MEEKGNTTEITLKNVHNLTTYELRQELVRRNEFNLKEDDPVNYKILLKMMVDLLTKEEQTRQQAHAQAVAESSMADREKMKAIREERKREAIERSLLRQADPHYLATRVAVTKTPIPSQPSSEISEINSPDKSEAEEKDDNTPSRNQPINPFGSSTKFKVFVR